MALSFHQPEQPEEWCGEAAGARACLQAYAVPGLQSWRTGRIRLLVLLLLWGAAFAPLCPALVNEWLLNSDNSHAFLVPLISLYLLWQKREAFRVTPLKSSKAGAVLFFFSLAAYVLSYGGGLAFPARIAMVSSLFGLLWLCLGNACLRLFAFPIAFLLFMVPVPYSLMSLVSMPLQLFVTTVSADIINSLGIPVYREGNMLYFMQTRLEVAEACSGIRSIMALSMLAFLLAYLGRPGWWRKALPVAAAIPVAMLANIGRVAGTGVLAHFYGDRVARGFLHDFSGLLVFFSGFGLLFALFYLVNGKWGKDVQ